MASQRMVLVVDGNPSDRLNTVLLLEGAGYRVKSARDFEEAKQAMAEETPDVLVTDIRLGPYNGLHLVLRSRLQHPHMAALVTSREPDPVLEEEARRQQAQFLLRPVSGRQLLEAITTSLRGFSRDGLGTAPPVLNHRDPRGIDRSLLK